MHLLLVRHGQSANNVIEAELGDTPAFYQRRTVDPPLSALGERQAQALGRHLGAQLSAAARSGRVHLVCSSMRRAMQTCAPLAAALALTPDVRPDCVERCAFFSMSADGTEQIPEPGPTRAEVKERFPTFDTSRLDDTALPALETASGARARADRVAAELMDCASGGDAPELIVLVAHADFIGQLARALLMAEPPAALDGDTSQPTGYAYWDLNNTATCHLVVLPPGQGNHRVRLLHWNRSDHLRERDRSGIAWRNLPGCSAAAEWARHGEGGTAKAPLFVEEDVVALCGGATRRSAIAATLAVSVAIAALAVSMKRAP